MAEAVVEGTGLEGCCRNTGHALQDGTPVAAWVRFCAAGAVATDRGATLARVRPSPALRLAIRALCRQNDVQLERGELRVRVARGGALAEALLRLGRVCAKVARLAD